MDKKDQQILALLSQNSRRSWKTIGDKVYLSGQAVGSRVEQLLDANIIEKFTIQIRHKNLQFITIYMNSNQFSLFEKRVCNYQEVLTMDKITGDGCYFIKACFEPDKLEQFITTISAHARYKISHRLNKIK
ncbi:AsnC family transcriptional regulator [Orbus wheelerorum]|uniref:Lrp/AsnC family transcriptional regulator n=1 Tax=Orbus wheelerorum TaxID=3074111 RepID=UPI00370D3264